MKTTTFRVEQKATKITKTRNSQPLLRSLCLLLSVCPLMSLSSAPNPPIPIRFKLDSPGFVTLVIDDSNGKRVRNLISETLFAAGENVTYWDGLDDLGRDTKSAEAAVYHVPGKAVAPGRYTVRGLFRPELNLRYELTPYSHGHPPWKSKDRASEWLANHSAPSAILFAPESAAPKRDKPSPGGQIIVGSYVSEGGSGVAWLDLDGNKIHGQLWIGGVWTGATQLTRDEGSDPVPGVYAYSGSAWEGELRLYELLDEKSRERGPADSRFGTGEDRPVLKPVWKFPSGKFTDHEKRLGLSGLAVHNGLLVASLPTLNQLLFIDAKARKELGLAALNDPRGLAFDKQGRLLALSSNQLLRFTVERRSTSLPKPEVLVRSSLQNPQQLAFDGAGNIFLSDHGDSHQVKVFSPDGKFLRPIGVGGKPNVGPYNPKKMHFPNGITVASDGTLWVAETDKMPRRISIWKTSGEFVRAFYGPAQYGGGGFLDSEDKSRFFYADEGGTEFKIDWERGTAEPVAVYFRHDADPLGLVTHYGPACPPSMPIHRDGRTYLTDAHNNNPTAGWPAAGVWVLEKGVARPVAALGEPKMWNVFFTGNSNTFLARLPKDKDIKSDKLMFVWSDANDDARPQPDEVTVTANSVSSVNVMNDFSFVTGSGLHVKPQRFTKNGAPIYDAKNPVKLVAQTQNPASSGGGQVLVASDGWSVFTTPPKPFSPYGLAGVRNGEPVWSYPNMWPGLHASHHSPVPEFPGELIGTTRLLGSPVRVRAAGVSEASFPSPRPSPSGRGSAAARGGINQGAAIQDPSTRDDRRNIVSLSPGERGGVRANGTPNARGSNDPSEGFELFAINGNKGTIYLLTTDGLFVSTLFHDSRQASFDFAEHKRGMSVNKASIGEEYFWATITQTRDGEVWLQVHDGELVRVEGIEKLRRLPDQQIEVTAQQLVAARDWQIQTEAARQQTNTSAMTIGLLARAPTVDGKADEWPTNLFVTIDTRRLQIGDWGSKKVRTEAALAVSGERLYACFKTAEPDLLDNSGDSWPMHFKTGGALDVMLGTDANANPARKAAAPGDLRLLVTLVKKKPTAVLYRPVAPGSGREAFPFSSPLRTVKFDRIDDMSSQLEFKSAVARNEKERTQSAVYEFSIPLATLGLKPAAGQSIRGDIGVLRGNGSATLHRSYWRNKSAALTSDVPSEAELLPNLWGAMNFEAIR
jgi:hypothetical protein